MSGFFILPWWGGIELYTAPPELFVETLHCNVCCVIFVITETLQCNVSTAFSLVCSTLCWGGRLARAHTIN